MIYIWDGEKQLCSYTRCENKTKGIEWLPGFWWGKKWWTSSEKKRLENVKVLEKNIFVCRHSKMPVIVPHRLICVSTWHPDCSTVLEDCLTVEGDCCWISGSVGEYLKHVGWCNFLSSLCFLTEDTIRPLTMCGCLSYLTGMMGCISSYTMSSNRTFFKYFW